MGGKTKHGQLNTLEGSWRWGLSLEQLAWDLLKGRWESSDGKLVEV